MEQMFNRCGAQNYAVNAPYPDTSGACPNEFDAALISCDYAGSVSELSAVTSYVFRDHMTPTGCEAVMHAFEQIAIVEMRHMNLLANTLTALGARPVYAAGCSRCRQSWNANYVDYVVGVEPMLRRSIAEEEAAIAQYRAHIARISQPCIRALLERIIQDEELHIRIFNCLLERCCGAS